MAKADWDAAAQAASAGRDYDTANERVQETVFPNPDTDAKAAAKAAKVSNAAFIDYDLALSRHAARPDIEDLKSKNRRNAPATFADADHMRATPNSQGPTPGSVRGVAPHTGNVDFNNDGSIGSSEGSAGTGV